MRPRIKDVAKDANVSIATVSRVIHGNGYVADATKKQVISSIKKLNYHLDLSAQNLRTKKTTIIAHICTAPFISSYFGFLAKGVDEEAAFYDFETLTLNVNNRDDIIRALRAVNQRRVDGAIISTSKIKKTEVAELSSYGLPIVMVPRYFDLPGIDRVAPNNIESVHMAVEHLVQLNHKKILYLSKYPTVQSNELSYGELDRKNGFLRAVRNFGLNESDQIIMESDYSIAEGVRMTQEAIDNGSSFSSILATSDALALGAMQTLYKNGRKIPDDVSVMGFNNVLAQYSMIPLTTIAQPMEELGHTAVRLLLDRIGRRYNGEARTIILNSRLIVRDTTGPHSKL